MKRLPSIQSDLISWSTTFLESWSSIPSDDPLPLWACRTNLISDLGLAISANCWPKENGLIWLFFDESSVICILHQNHENKILFESPKIISHLNNRRPRQSWIVDALPLSFFYYLQLAVSEHLGGQKENFSPVEQLFWVVASSFPWSHHRHCW